MTLQQIRYVIAISEIGSLNKASEVLYVAQPSLSESVKELERELGITIFHRSGRGVTLTGEGVDFISHARELYHQYETILEKYSDGGSIKKKFAVSAQHYSFAVKSFVELVKTLDTEEYEFAVREVRTQKVIDDVCTLRSEIGVLYMSDFNAPLLTKLFRTNGLEFHELIECDAYVYIWKNHPLAQNRAIRFDELTEYPCLSFEQGGSGSMYLSEEILSTNRYPRTIKATDRATMLNLMVGLNGYTLCSGIICEELNGSDFIAVPYQPDDEHPSSKMKIGYITKKNIHLSRVGRQYVEELKKYLGVSNGDN